MHAALAVPSGAAKHACRSRASTCVVRRCRAARPACLWIYGSALGIAAKVNPKPVVVAEQVSWGMCAGVAPFSPPVHAAPAGAAGGAGGFIVRFRCGMRPWAGRRVCECQSAAGQQAAGWWLPAKNMPCACAITSTLCWEEHAALGQPGACADREADGTACCQSRLCIVERDAWRVLQGPYVLVLLNTGHAHRSNRLPAGWLLTTYRSLSRPFRKHVKRIVLARAPQPGRS